MNDMRKAKSQTSGYMTSFGERVGYWSYFAGQSISYGMLNSFVTTYMLMNGVDITKIAFAMFLVKAWDAVNDTIFGVIYDRIKFKSGNKCIPWLRVTNIIIPLTTVLIYLSPSSLGENGKIIWFIVSYILWDTSYTLSDIPLYSMVTTMTSNPGERSTILSRGRVWAMIGGGGFAMLASSLVSEQVGLSFTKVATIAAALIVLTMLPVSVKGKERVKLKSEKEEHYTFKSMFRYLKTNKYLLLFYTGNLIFGTLSTGGPLGLFVSYYLFGSAMVSVVTSFATSGVFIIVSLFIGKLLARFDKFRMFYVCIIAVAALRLLTYFLGYQSLAVYIAMQMLTFIPYGIVMIMELTFTPDCVEYGRYKTGVDARGISFAIQSFAAKFAAVSNSLSLFLVGLFGWISVEASSFADLQAQNITQSPEALNGLWIVSTLVPAIGALLCLIPYSFYRLRDKDVQIMAKCNSGEISREEAESLLPPKLSGPPAHPS